VDIARPFLVLALLLASIMSAKAQSDDVAGPVTVSGLEPGLIENINIDPDQPINDLAAQLLHALEQSGYILATVTTVSDRHLHVDLGKITLITVTNLGPDTERAVKDLLANVRNNPRQAELDRALALINDLPGISATFAIKRIEGENSFEVVVSGSERWQFGALSLDSTPRNQFAQNRINLQQDFYGVAMAGDVVRFQGVYIDGDGKPEEHSLFASYQRPIGSQGAYGEIGYGDIGTEVDVRGESTAEITNTGFTIHPGVVTNHDFFGQFAFFTLGYPVTRYHDRSTYLVSNLDYTSDDTSGVGDTNTWTVDLSLFHSYQDQTGSSFAVGVTLGGGNTESYIDADDGDFYHLQLGSGYIQPLSAISPATELRLEGYGQISTTDTPNSKTMGFGGTDFLRGYESSTFSGNSGFVGTIEAAHAFDFSGDIFQRVVPFVFADFGMVHNPDKKQNTTTRPGSDSLVSVGLGTRINMTQSVLLDGYVGVPLMEDANDHIPGPAGYMKLTWSW